MARIAGVNIPLNKRVEIGLTYIYGIGQSTAGKVLDEAGVDKDTHVKDLTDFRSRESQVAVGEGAIPFPAIFRALQTIKFPGYVNLEYEIKAKDPLPGMQMSFAYMRGVLAALAFNAINADEVEAAVAGRRQTA